MSMGTSIEPPVVEFSLDIIGSNVGFYIKYIDDILTVFSVCNRNPHFFKTV